LRTLLTGGSGDLGIILSKKLEERGDIPVRLDIRSPKDNKGIFFKGSILDRNILPKCTDNIQCLVHIAAWHGIHLVRGEKNVYDFWDLNVTGTVNVFEAAARAGIKNIVYISSTSIEEPISIYGHTKVIAEEVAHVYKQRHNLNLIILRPGAFIPYWNQYAYPENSFYEWAKWFWKGAVHIDDVACAVISSIDLLARNNLTQIPPLTVDGIFEYTTEDLQNWDQNGPGTTFKIYYPEYYEMIIRLGFDPSIKPMVRDMSETVKVLNYAQTYGMRNLLHDLADFGREVPPKLQ